MSIDIYAEEGVFDDIPLVRLCLRNVSEPSPKTPSICLAIPLPAGAQSNAGQRGPRALSGPSPYSAHHARGAYHPREAAAASAASAAAPMFPAPGGGPPSSPERQHLRGQGQGPISAGGGRGSELGGSPGRSWVGQSPGRPADLRGARGHSVPAVRK